MATLSKKKPNTLFIAQFAILLALEAIVCFTPLGSIPIGPLVATLAMLPVIVAGILLGTRRGGGHGLCRRPVQLHRLDLHAPQPGHGLRVHPHRRARGIFGVSSSVSCPAF